MGAVDELFKDIDIKFPDYEYMNKGNKIYFRKKSLNEEGEVEERAWTEDDIAGYTFHLSTATNKKSTPYPHITTMVFDEFLLDEGPQKYLPGEVRALLNLYETIARPVDTSEMEDAPPQREVKLFLLANTITITNPYFLYFDLKVPKRQDRNGKWIWKHPTKDILVENVMAEEYMEAKKRTKFGKIVEGTDYFDYSMNNQFILDEDYFIERKSPQAKHAFNISYKGNLYGVWFDYSIGRMWVCEATDPYGITYTLTLKDHKPNTMLLKSRNKTSYFKLFFDMFQAGNVFFENMNIKNHCYEILKMIWA